MHPHATEDPLSGKCPPGSSAFSAAVTRQIARRPIFDRVYFRSLRDGSMGKAGFQRSQAQFFFAVQFFARPMAALAARLPGSRARMPLVRNLAEEHGEFCPPNAHDHTFLQFLQTIGVTAEVLPATREGTEVRAFNHARSCPW